MRTGGQRPGLAHTVRLAHEGGDARDAAPAAGIDGHVRSRWAWRGWRLERGEGSMRRGRQSSGDRFDRTHLLRLGDRVDRALELFQSDLAANVACAHLLDGGALRDNQG